MKKIGLIFTAVLSGVVVAACDLQPKILSFPDTVGEFISARYPALLADPETQPEIYNSAASDYGVYAAPTLYGSVENTDYVEYASVDDYIVPPSVTALYGDVSTGVDVGESVVQQIIGDYQCPKNPSLEKFLLHSSIEFAKRKLAEDSCTVTRIADALKFDTIHYFTAFFKKHTGISPREYRAGIKKESVQPAVFKS